MIVCIILMIAIFASAIIYLCLKFDGHEAIVLLASLIVFAAVLATTLKCIKNNLVGDAEKYQFYIDDQKYEMFYDRETDRYFKIANTSNWNPINWIGIEYLKTEDVERFFEAYEAHERAYDELKEANVFG